MVQQFTGVVRIIPLILVLFSSLRSLALSQVSGYAMRTFLCTLLHLFRVKNGAGDIRRYAALTHGTSAYSRFCFFLLLQVRTS